MTIFCLKIISDRNIFHKKRNCWMSFCFKKGFSHYTSERLSTQPLLFFKVYFSEVYFSKDQRTRVLFRKRIFTLHFCLTFHSVTFDLIIHQNFYSHTSVPIGIRNSNIHFFLMCFFVVYACALVYLILVVSIDTDYKTLRASISYKSR